MMSFKVFGLLAVLSVVSASPEHLQRLYDAPSASHDHDHHDHHDHHGSDGIHHDIHHDIHHGSHHDIVHGSGIAHNEHHNDFHHHVDSAAHGSDAFHQHELGDGVPRRTNRVHVVEGTSDPFFDGGIVTATTTATQFDVLSTASPNRPLGLTIEGTGSSDSATEGKTVQELVNAAHNTQQQRQQLEAQRGELIGTLEIANGLNIPSQEDLTITVEHTHDVYTTFTNIFYNSIPVTLTQFVKTTRVEPTLKVVGTPVDDRVLVSTAPVTRTDTITVTDTRTSFQFRTEVSTDTYTVTHRAYDIQQQLVSSTIVQTQVIRPTIISTVIFTEFETSTVSQTVTNTIVIEPRPISSSFSNSVNVGSNGFSEFTTLAEQERNHDILTERQSSLITRALDLQVSNEFVQTLLSELQEIRDSVHRADRSAIQARIGKLQTRHSITLDTFQRHQAAQLQSSQAVSHDFAGAHGYY